MKIFEFSVGLDPNEPDDTKWVAADNMRQAVAAAERQGWTKYERLVTLDNITTKLGLVGLFSLGVDLVTTAQPITWNGGAA